MVSWLPRQDDAPMLSVHLLRIRYAWSGLRSVTLKGIPGSNLSSTRRSILNEGKKVIVHDMTRRKEVWCAPQGPERLGFESYNVIGCDPSLVNVLQITTTVKYTPPWLYWL